MNSIVQKASVVLVTLLFTQNVFAQVPVISYTTPQTFYVDANIGTVTPTVSNNPVPFTGYTTTIAGNGSAGFNNALGTAASFNQPLGTAVDALGNIYVADAANNMIRMITPAGQVTTFAGGGGQGSTNGSAANASFNHPVGMCVDGAGNIYVADENNNMIRKITAGGIVSTFAGAGAQGSSDGPAANATFYHPCGVAVDEAGNVYVGDNSNNTIRKITSAGIVSTIAGNGLPGSTDATGTSATFNQPFSVALDPFGNLYVADRYNHKIRKIVLETGVVSTVAGTGTPGFANNAIGTNASFNYPTTIICDALGNVYVTDYHNNQIRMITPAGVVTTLAGSPTLSSGSADGTGTSATFNYPFAISIDALGNLYVGDLNMNLIRRVATRAYSITPNLPAGLSFIPANGFITGTPSVASPATNYTVSAYNGTGKGSTILNITVATPVIFPSQNMDFITTYTPRIAGLTTQTAVVAASNNKSNVETSIEYFDGMGRPEQIVQAQGSPAGNDLVQPLNYDQTGREVLKYLSYALSTSMTSNGSFKTDALQLGAGLNNFYNPSGSTGTQLPGGLPHITSPYAGINYEFSPLNRVIQQGAPGDPWQLSTSGVAGSGHTVYTAYSSNAATDQVLLWNVNTAGGATGNSYYAPGTLSKITTTDENGNNSIQFIDNENKVVCKMVQNGSGPVTYLSTYYIYDDFNNLAYVIPPLPVGTALPVTFLETDPIFTNFIYGYHYDARNRLIERIIPGKNNNWEYQVYNTLDQVIATQDGNQRVNNQWTFTKYDAIGRMVLTGIWSSATTRPALQTLINGLTTPLWESRPNGGYPTNTAWPTSYLSTLAVNYYDNYTFPDLPSKYNYISSASNMTKGLLTGKKISVLNSSAVLYDINYYDDLGRVVKMYDQHYLGGTTGVADVRNFDAITNTIDFVNNISISARQHYNTINTSAVLTVTDMFTFDHKSRKTQTKEQINTGTPIILAQYGYNEVGQAIIKKLHSIDLGATFLQTVDYRYNPRGWLTSINNATLMNDGLINTGANDQFGEELSYEATSTTDPNYNGNISTMKWTVPAVSGVSSTSFAYDFRYDKLNRLKEAVSSSSGVKDGNYNEFINYDNLGNILRLGRYALTGTTPPFVKAQVDSLVYTYTGNQQTRIDDISGNNVYGFNDRVQQANEYTYDNNGNMIKDLNKGISNYSYNLFNLPSSITTQTGSVTYVYDAEGTKLSKKFVGINTTTTEYIKGIEYDGGAISFFATETGRARWNGSGYNYEYDIQDHLGNTRVTVVADHLDGTQRTPKIAQLNSYYAFGSDMPHQSYIPNIKNEYLYNKKEYQEETNLYDYGARGYDPVIGRWTTIDPLAERYRNTSTYSFTNNNPVNAFDDDGRRVIYVNGYWNPAASAIGQSPPSGGLGYWLFFDRSFVSKSRDMIGATANESDVYVDGSDAPLSSAHQRFEDGYQYAMDHYSELISGLQNGEGFEFVSHSQGGPMQLEWRIFYSIWDKM